MLTKDELLLLTEDVYSNYKVKPTAKAVENNELKSDSISEDKYWSYWTRTRKELESNHVYMVNKDGIISTNNAYWGRGGVRPVLYLDVSNIILDDECDGSELNAHIVKSYGLDTQKPEIINNRDEENILKDSVYGEEQIRNGVIATDDVDGDITSNIEVSGDIVDSSKLGDYIIRYNVEDNAGNKANEVTRVVHVLKEIPKYEGYEVGTLPEDRKYFKYYIGLDKRDVIRCLMVCADGGNDTLKKLFNREDIIDLNTYKFKNCYYIDREGEIKKYNVD